MSQQPHQGQPDQTQQAPQPQQGQPDQTQQGQQPQQGQQGRSVVVMTPEGMGVAGGGAPNPTEQVERPDKVMRIGSMVKQLLEEVRSAPLDERGRARLAQVHQRSLAELEEGLSPDLVAELQRVSLPFDSEQVPSDAELRIAQAQLVGWLEGLFHGIQTAVFAQQMAARSQQEQVRRALPGGGQQAAPGAGAPGQVPGGPGGPPQPTAGGPQQGTGQYL